MQPAVWLGALVALLLPAGARAYGCERFPGEQLPTIGLNEANLEPCGFGSLQPARAQVVYVSPAMDWPPPEFMPDPLFQVPLRRPRACQTQTYQFRGGPVRVHRC